MSKSYQRARTPEQKAERKELILRAAEALLDAKGDDSSALSLNELARRVGMAKSNLYRYFESREAVLLALLTKGMRHWSTDVVTALDSVDASAGLQHRLDALVTITCDATSSRPRMCHLMSVLASVLEQNVSLGVVRLFKTVAREELSRVAAAMHQTVPELGGGEAQAELLHHAFAYIVGAWPLSHPNEVVAQVMSEPAFAPMAHHFAQDLRRVVLLLARGLLAED